MVTSLSRIVPKCTQNVFDGIKINFQVGRSLLVRAAWIPLISASPLCKNEQQRLMAITWIRPHICHRYHTLYPWRKICLVEKLQISVKNLNNLWSFIEIYAVFVKNLCGEYFCGEKMTNMRSDMDLSHGWLCWHLSRPIRECPGRPASGSPATRWPWSAL